MDLQERLKITQKERDGMLDGDCGEVLDANGFAFARLTLFGSGRLDDNDAQTRQNK